MAAALAACSSEPGDDPVPQATSSTTTSTTLDVEGSDGDAGLEAGVGVDVDSKTITLGVLADLSGSFASLAADVVDAQRVYWERINDEGGIAGWTVELEVADTRNDVLRHIEAYEQLRTEVLAISHATGSTANIEALGRYIDDDMVVIPMSWYSGWPFPFVDGRIMVEQYTNYCLEAVNAVDFVQSMGATSLNIVTDDNAYGRDAAAGAKVGSDFYGLVIGYDGTGSVAEGGELSPVIGAIVDSGADWTFLATNPALGAEIIAGAVRFGYEGLFIGATPSYDSRLLDSAAAELYDTRFFQSAYVTVWGDPAPGNMEMMAAMRLAYPDRRPSDAFIVGWNAGVTMRSVLERAVLRGDLTRSGVLAAASATPEVDFGGAAPTQRYAGSPDQFVTRETAIYQPDLDRYLAAGGVGQTISDPDATTGSVLVREFTASEAAVAASFTEPCFGLD
ncbi:MAG: ABC transporter substrate-binding protein [Acidimicrobiia bacterium]|nr:ABC transporter substrate-binding protein [Acidimicrobiia bacterium]